MCRDGERVCVYGHPAAGGKFDSNFKGQEGQLLGVGFFLLNPRVETGIQYYLTSGGACRYVQPVEHVAHVACDIAGRWVEGGGVLNSPPSVEWEHFALQ